MENRGVLVTGASGGIGGAAVRSLAERGYLVYATVRGDDAASRALAALPGVRLVRMDVADPGSVAAAADTIGAEVAGLRAVVNNAGVIVQGPLELVPPAELRRQFEVNTLGPTFVTQAFLPLLRAGNGRVVNVSAPTGRIPMPFLAPLSASKAALESLTTALRLELAAWNVPVIVVEPGSTQTRIFDKADAAAKAALQDTDPRLIRLYRDHLARMDKTQARMRQRPVQPVADAIVTAVTARKPRRRYPVGDARTFGVLLRLPTGLRERLVISALGLRGAKAGQ
jgi:NAD(P)-dependent dehydrogenase (short-subunit alcohol dehydrogenase family)